MTWNLADAKNRFSGVVNLALSEELAGRKPDLKEYLLQAVGLDELELTRDRSPGRDVDP